MLASILIGLAALVAVSLSSAFLLFAHLTGRIRRSTALTVAVSVVAIGGTLAAAGMMEGFLLGHLATPIGVFLMLAAGVNGLLAYQASKSAARG
jgi:hypothetical protein